MFTNVCRLIAQFLVFEFDIFSTINENRKYWRNAFLIEHFGARFNTSSFHSQRNRAPRELPNQNYKQFMNE